MKVKNINGTTNNKCKCGSWLKHWKNYSGEILIKCRAKGCSVPANLLEGAHVQKDVDNDDKWYIIPFCATHNRASQGAVEIVEGTSLVLANVSNTCGK